MKSMIVFAALAFAASPSPAAEKPDSDPRVKKMLDQKKIQYQVDEAGDFQVTYQVGKGRTQLAFIRSDIYKYGALKIREVLSIGYRSALAEFPANVANRMLEHNNQAKLGAWAKQGQLAIFTTKIPTNASAKELIDAIEMTVTLADQMEREFNGSKDEF